MTAEVGRSYLLMQPPVTFNGGLIIFLHGATGSAEQFSTPSIQQEFLNLMAGSGFMIMIPNARADFAQTEIFYPRWESEAPNNPDVQFIQYVTTTLINNYNDLNKVKIKNVFIFGGSSGGFMATRAATDILTGIKGVALLNAGFWSQAAIVGGNTLVFNNNPITVRSGFPPTLLINSTIDVIVTAQVKGACHQALTAAGVDCTVISDNGGQHEWVDWVRPYNSQILAWFVAHNTP